MKIKLSDRQFHLDPRDRVLYTGNQRLILYVAAAVAAAVLLVISYSAQTSTFCSPRAAASAGGATSEPDSPARRAAILKYATTATVPQQSRAEISASFDALAAIAPCNLLVFGLGHDALMWDALNEGGATLFLEEDPWWVHTVLAGSPHLRAATVHYRTQLSEADALLRGYRREPRCVPPGVGVEGNFHCRLALSDLPGHAYAREWDAIMIDAPRGYFPEAPGRMAAIFTAAAMARGRTRGGVTRVFLHDVDRKVERMYAEEFLCAKYRVREVERLWHFEIPPEGRGGNATATASFC